MKHRLISSEDVRIIDVNARFFGLDTRILMENAGRSAAEILERRLGNVSGRRIAIVCGTGNNGGDGMVLARFLSIKGAHVTVYLLGRPSDLKSDATKENWRVLSEMGSVRKIVVRDEGDLDLSGFDVVIDAILGVGARGVPRGLARIAIEKINESSALKVSLDIPSGLDPDRGRVWEPCVEADLVITMHAPKLGLRNYLDRVEVANIGLPRDIEILCGPGDVIACLPERRKDSHKGEHGRIAVIGGSKDYSGAPALAALASLKTGADLAVIYCPRSVREIIASFSPNIICRSCGDDYLNPSELPAEELERFDAIIFGNGAGKREELREVFRVIFDLMRRSNTFLVVDADALDYLPPIPEDLRGRVVLTPHYGEFRRNWGDLSEDPIRRAEELSSKASDLGCTILLKGWIDVIASHDGRFKLNKSGNPGMTVGGTGDVLAGVLGAFLAFRKDPFRAACAASFLNGLAGDLARDRFGDSLLATDLIEIIPSAIRECLERARG